MNSARQPFGRGRAGPGRRAFRRLRLTGAAVNGRSAACLTTHCQNRTNTSLSRSASR